MNSSDLNVDLNAIKILLGVIATLIAIVGWFIKKEISSFANRIDKHDERFTELAGIVQRLIGYYEATKNHSIDMRSEDKPPSSSERRGRRTQ